MHSDHNKHTEGNLCQCQQRGPTTIHLVDHSLNWWACCQLACHESLHYGTEEYLVLQNGFYKFL